MKMTNKSNHGTMAMLWRWCYRAKMKRVHGEGNMRILG